MFRRRSSTTEPALPTFADQITLKFNQTVLAFDSNSCEWNDVSRRSSVLSDAPSQFQELDLLQKQRDFLLNELASARLDIKSLIDLLNKNQIKSPIEKP
ncbi:hypothetical protein P9112_008236 [Eukaryota sp. TZLM1-RC]